METGDSPERKFESAETFKAMPAETNRILIDATERPHQRPQESEKQKALYRGKKTTYHPEFSVLTFQHFPVS